LNIIEKEVQPEKNWYLLIDKRWLLSLKEVVHSFFGNKIVRSLLFEHGQNVGRIFFQETQKNIEKMSHSSLIYLDKLCEWLKHSSFGKLEIINYKFSEYCECRITNYLKELESTYYCGLLAGFLDCLWEKEISVKCNVDSSDGSIEVILQ
jgi:hypothetical protein